METLDVVPYLAVFIVNPLIFILTGLAIFNWSFYSSFCGTIPEWGINMTEKNKKLHRRLIFYRILGIVLLFGSLIFFRAIASPLGLIFEDPFFSVLAIIIYLALIPLTYFITYKYQSKHICNLCKQGLVDYTSFDALPFVYDGLKIKVMGHKAFKVMWDGIYFVDIIEKEYFPSDDRPILYRDYGMRNISENNRHDKIRIFASYITVKYGIKKFRVESESDYYTMPTGTATSIEIGGVVKTTYSRESSSTFSGYLITKK